MNVGKGKGRGRRGRGREREEEEKKEMEKDKVFTKACFVQHGFRIFFSECLPLD